MIYFAVGEFINGFNILRWKLYEYYNIPLLFYFYWFYQVINNDKFCDELYSTVEILERVHVGANISGKRSDFEAILYKL